MAQKKVLITGMSGLIGGIVRERLEGTYALSALNPAAAQPSAIVSGSFLTARSLKDVTTKHPKHGISWTIIR